MRRVSTNGAPKASSFGVGVESQDGRNSHSSRKARYDFTALRRLVRHDTSISSSVARFFEDVCELAEESGECRMQQATFEARYKVTETTIRRWEKSLVDAGYLTKGKGFKDRRCRTLKPRLDAVLNATRGEQPTENTEHSASLPDIDGCEIPVIPGHTPRDISLSERERGARAYVREGPGLGKIKEGDTAAVAVYVTRCNRRPSSLLAEEIASDVGDGDEALRTWAVVCETWAATNEPGSSKKAYNLGNVRKMLRAFHEEVQAENERRAANTGKLPEAIRCAGQANELSQEALEALRQRAAELDAVIAALPDEECENLRRQAAESLDLSHAYEQEHHPMHELIANGNILAATMRDLVERDQAGEAPQ